MKDGGTGFIFNMLIILNYIKIRDKFLCLQNNEIRFLPDSKAKGKETWIRYVLNHFSWTAHA